MIKKLDPIVADIIDKIQDLPLFTITFPKGTKKATKEKLSKIFNDNLKQFEQEVVKRIHL